MSRQRLRESAVKWNITLTNESFALKLLKTVELKSITNKSKHVKVNACDKVNKFIKQNFTEDIKYFENKNKIKIEFLDDNTLIIPDHKIEFQNKSKKTIEKIESLSKLQNLETLNSKFENIKINQKNNKFKKKKFYKKKFYKKKPK
jgi:ribonuclease E